MYFKLPVIHRSLHKNINLYCNIQTSTSRFNYLNNIQPQWPYKAKTYTCFQISMYLTIYRMEGKQSAQNLGL